MTLRLRRGTDLQRQGIVLAEGELVYVTDTKEIYAGDGSTLGGIKVTGDVLGSPPRLTQNLDLDGYIINGIGGVNITGSITAGAFTGDGSGLTNLPSTGTGVIVGQEYSIDIQGSVRADSSTVLVDAATESFYGNFIGDGSLISNITLDQLSDVSTSGVLDGEVLTWNNSLSQWQASSVSLIGDGSLITNITLDQLSDVVTSGVLDGEVLTWNNSLGRWQPSPISSGTGVIEGNNYRINIVGDDSSVIVDTATKNINGNFIGNGSLITNITIDQLFDVNTIGVSNGDVLTWSQLSQQWVAGEPTAPITEGSNYRINIVGNDSSVIVNTATNTINGDFVGDGSLITNININQLVDFSTFNISDGDILYYQTDTWINAPLDLDRLGDVDSASATMGDVLYYDGVTWRNVNLDGLVTRPGSDYNINIVGNDSTRIIDVSSGNITGNFIGDGSLISNLELNQNTDVSILSPAQGDILQYLNGSWINTTLPPGIIEGSDYSINIIGNDSTKIIDVSNNTVTTNKINHNNLTFENTNTGGFSIVDFQSTDAINSLSFYRRSSTPLDPLSPQFISQITFFAEDNTTTNLSGVIYSFENTLLIAAGQPLSSPTTYSNSQFLQLRNNNLCVGGVQPTEKLDVRGNGVFAGSVKLNDGVLILNESRSLGSILTPAVGSVTYNVDLDTLSFYDGTEWRNVIHSDNTELFTFMPGAVVLAGVAQSTINIYGTDSTDLTGGFLYNSDTDRFEFFQAGSWVKLPNNGNTIGNVLKWSGTEWVEAPETGVAPTASNSDFLDGFDGTHYLDYTNFTNTPSIPTDTGDLTNSAGFITASSSATLTNKSGAISQWTNDSGYLTSVAFGDLTSTPTTLAGYGITDAATSAQGALADTAVQPADLGSFTFTSSTLDTSDSSGIVVTPAVTFSSDVTVENDLVVTNKITVDTLEVANLITTPGAGTPEIESDGAILLTAGTRVEISSSPLKMASFTTAERDVLSAENGDMIYNSTTNKFQGYANGTWVDLH